MSTLDPARLIAWDRELRAVHARLRDSLQVAREAVDDEADGTTGGASPSRELLLICTGFCAALDGHHRGEDDVVFPGLLSAAPELREVVSRLVRDHAMLSHLLGELQRVVDAGHAAGVHDTAALHRHLDGIDAVMETHFRYEEKRLLPALADLVLDATPRSALGPLAPDGDVTG
ncbi:hemerythrin domain-containing protein [Cellulomonas dongxiuzhuiae]|uniref:hemerythrin domain-containing protein n=1 Tax=Cellulomonas dongxiuzhuiae TaxID=2819979 RepID=UPI001AAE69A3|nr:hemerythrin domain-containing protein [Cellulomonas dongxiuzhuiae]MBO3089392.1 hemerythrin domain-containing protein [Cellulomonas dongxiuzhuiae]